jgi:hypothetical protein
LIDAVLFSGLQRWVYPPSCKKTVLGVNRMLPASNNNSPQKSSTQHHHRIEIDDEPDLLTGTLDEWHTYRQALTALPQENENVRVAIAVTDARIARLKADR